MIKQLFNDQWFFRRGLDNPMASAFMGPGAGLVPVTLPHDAMLLSERKKENIDEMGIGYFTPENVEYEKILVLDPSDTDKSIYLEFEGVYSNAVLEVNGHVAARHPFGFTGFVSKISDYLRPGQNKLKVTVLNGIHPNGRYYTGTGIYRDVKLMMGDRLHILPDGVRLTTLDANETMASLEVAVTVRNDDPGHKKAKLIVRLVDQEGRETAKTGTVVNLISHEKLTVRQKLYIPEPFLWGCEEPYLYRYEVLLEEIRDGMEMPAAKAAADTAAGTFGIRKVSLDPVRGLSLNGNGIKLKGGCIHGDNGCIGAVSLPDAEERRIRMLKEAGYNAVRTAHNPVSHAFLDACDKYGMLVMEEYADAWTHSKPAFDYSIWMNDCWEQDIEDMVRTAFNHPSVIMYSIGNEITDVGSDYSAVWGRRFAEKLKSIDPTRLVTNGINVMMANLDKMDQVAASMDIDMQTGEINNMMAQVKDVMGALVTHPVSLEAIEESCGYLDIVGFNYAAHLYEILHEKNPNRIFVGTETNPPELDRNWELVEKQPHVIGDFAWTCWDYLGEPGIGRIEERREGFNVYAPYPWVAAYCGDFDLTGYRRPVSYWRETIWNGRRHRPYIAVCRPQNIGKDLYYSQWSWSDSIHSWTWPGQEGKKTLVEVYTDAQEAELFLNGDSLGRKAARDNRKKCCFCWETKYLPGILEAVTYVEGIPAGRQILQTVTDAKPEIRSDRQVLHAGSRELAYVEIEYRDENNTLDMSRNQRVFLKASGAVMFAGAGSADPRTEDPYTGTEFCTFEGRMIAVIRAGKSEGRGTLSVRDEDGNKAEIEFAVE